MFDDRLQTQDYSSSTLNTEFSDTERPSALGEFRAMILALGVSATSCVTPEALKPREYPDGGRYPELIGNEINILQSYSDNNNLGIAGAKSYRVFVSDGAFFQHEKYSASSWVQDLSAEIIKDRPDISIDVTCFTYSERTEIASSAHKFAELVCAELRKQPLKEDEKILLVGHSQGAFIQTYLLKKHEQDPNYCPGFPWNSLIGSITIDLPLGDLQEYRGNFSSLLSPLIRVVKTDPIVTPALLSLIYPAAFDYIRETDSLKLVASPAAGETRFIRTDSAGKPVFIDAAGSDIDNPDSQWSHHPFLAGHVALPKNIEFREKLRESFCEKIGIVNFDPTPGTQPVAAIPFSPFFRFR